MRKFLLKAVIGALAPSLIFFLSYFALSLAAPDGVTPNVIEAYMRAVLPDPTQADLILGGDSRAVRQLDTSIFEAETGLRTVNVGVPGSDLRTFLRAAQRQGLLKNPKIRLILCVSIQQVNDGALDVGYLSWDCIAAMTFWEKCRLLFADANYFAGAPEIASKCLLGRLRQREAEPAAVEKDILDQKGFAPFQSRMTLPVTVSLDPRNTKHPLYKNLRIEGARWRIFRQTLRQLGQTHRQIVFVNQPFSPAWVQYTHGTFIEQAEKKFSENLAREIRQYPNMAYLDLCGQPSPELTNDMFYDIQHANKDGAAVISRMVIRNLQWPDGAQLPQR